MRRLLVLITNIFSLPMRIFNHISLFCLLQEVKIDKTAYICTGVKFYRGKIGKYSYIGNNSFVIDTDIGNFTSISTDCYIGGTTHPIEWVSTSPLFHKWDNIMKQNFAFNDFSIFKKTFIGNDVWIGNRVIIKAGITIGDGAIIGMGAVVTKDVGPYEIWVGNPAKIIRKRFDEKTIIKLNNIKWWNWSDKTILEYANTFTSTQDLFSKIEDNSI